MPRPLETCFAHTAGVCDLVYAPDGRHIVTCGSDNTVNVIDLSTKQPVHSLTDNDDAVNALALSHDGAQLAVGAENRKVLLYSFPEPKFKSMVTRLTLPVRHVAFSKSDLLLAVAGDDHQVRVVNVINPKEVGVLRGHDASVRCVAFDPKGDYLASASADLSVILWNMDSRESVSTLRNVLSPAAAQQTERVCRLAWHPHGTWLAVPGVEGIKMYRREDFELAFVIQDGGMEDIDVVAWSPNGRYIAAGTMDGEIIVFDVSTRESLSKFHNTVKPMALRWSPVGNALAMIDADGRFAIIDNPIPAHMAPPFGSAPAPVTAAASKPAPAAPKSAAGAAAGTTAAPAAANTSASGAGESSDDEVGDAPVVRRRATTRRLRAAGSTGGADSVAAVKARLGLLQDSDEEFDESKAFLEAQAELERAAREREGRSAEAVTVQHVPVVTARHPVVQPGATPEGLKRRFLAWNAVGSITTRDEATYSSIEVEFSDSSANRPVRFTDHYGFAIAAMSPSGAVFASRSGAATAAAGATAAAAASEDAGVDADGAPKPRAAGDIASTIFYKPFRAWAHKSEWVAQLPSGENAEAIASGMQWVAWLRVFRFTGVQAGLVRLPGPVVAMVGSGATLLVFHDKGMGSGEQRRLGFQLFDMDGGYEGDAGLTAAAQRSAAAELARGTITLAPDAELTWLGFSDAGAALMADSEGALHALSPQLGWQWVPVMDTRSAASVGKHAGANFWPVCVVDGKLMCVISRGESAYPQTLPKPVLAAVPLRMPLLQTDSTAGALQEQLLREEAQARAVLALPPHCRPATEDGGDAASMAELRRLTTEADKTTLKLVEVCCKLDKCARALDLAARLFLPQSLKIAIMLAQRHDRMQLADRMHILLQARFVQENDTTVAAAVSSIAPRAQPSRAAYAAMPKAAASARKPVPAEVEEEEERATDSDAQPRARASSKDKVKAPQRAGRQEASEDSDEAELASEEEGGAVDAGDEASAPQRKQKPAQRTQRQLSPPAGPMSAKTAGGSPDQVAAKRGLKRKAEGAPAAAPSRPANPFAIARRAGAGQAAAGKVAGGVPKRPALNRESSFAAAARTAMHGK